MPLAALPGNILAKCGAGSTLCDDAISGRCDGISCFSFAKVSVMPQTVSKIEVWTGEIEDKPGALDAKLQPLAAAGVDLTFLIARRQADRPGRGVVFLAPLK